MLSDNSIHLTTARNSGTNSPAPKLSLPARSRPPGQDHLRSRRRSRRSLPIPGSTQTDLKDEIRRPARPQPAPTRHPTRPGQRASDDSCASASTLRCRRNAQTGHREPARAANSPTLSAAPGTHPPRTRASPADNNRHLLEPTPTTTRQHVDEHRPRREHPVQADESKERTQDNDRIEPSHRRLRPSSPRARLAAAGIAMAYKLIDAAQNPLAGRQCAALVPSSVPRRVPRQTARTTRRHHTRHIKRRDRTAGSEVA